MLITRSILSKIAAENFPHVVRVKRPSLRSDTGAFHWATAEFGKHASAGRGRSSGFYSQFPYNVEARWDVIGGKFLFKDLSDAVYFKLRWC